MGAEQTDASVDERLLRLERNLVQAERRSELGDDSLDRDIVGHTVRLNKLEALCENLSDRLDVLSGRLDEMGGSVEMEPADGRLAAICRDLENLEMGDLTYRGYTVDDRFSRKALIGMLHKAIRGYHTFGGSYESTKVSGDT